jgi:F-type H+-transporting ATPase subunit epsilon
MASTFTLEIYTPYRLFFSETVEMVILTIEDGEIGIEAGHDRFTAPVKCCVTKIKDKTGNWKTAFISDGIIEVKRHKSIVLVDNAEWPEEIDYERVLKSKKRAEDVLKNGAFKFELAAAKQKLRRVEARLKVLRSSSNPQQSLP